ncbi:MAG TPA: phosphoribosyltransferase [Woeseiaceae bacterium]
MLRIFDDRRDAGRALVAEIQRRELDDPLILGLPRGGVPVAFEIATALDAELDTLVVRKLGAPFQPELALGAIASGGIKVLNEDVLNRASGLNDSVLTKIIEREKLELARRERVYRGDREHSSLAGRNVVLVDDGMATGATMRAAALAVRSQRPAKLIVAVPTASRDALEMIEPLADEVICLEAPPHFYAVGEWYRHFGQTTDDEVRRLLDKSVDIAAIGH